LFSTVFSLEMPTVSETDGESAGIQSLPLELI